MGGVGEDQEEGDLAGRGGGEGGSGGGVVDHDGHRIARRGGGRGDSEVVAEAWVA